LFSILEPNEVDPQELPEEYLFLFLKVNHGKLKVTRCLVRTNDGDAEGRMPPQRRMLRNLCFRRLVDHPSSPKRPERLQSTLRSEADGIEANDFVREVEFPTLSRATGVSWGKLSRKVRMAPGW
jgi:hypothetical protein